MKTKHLPLLALALAMGAAPLAPIQAASAPQPVAGSAERGHQRAAEDLLGKAVAYLEAEGADKALAAFNDRQGHFAEGQYYVFALDRAGIMRASSGASRSLVGLDVRALKDAAGVPFMNEILDAAAKAPRGEVRYHWLNPADNKVEDKVSRFQVVGDLILAVGYYLPRGTAEQARALLDKAVALIGSAGQEQAFQAFNDPQGGFVVGDEYVFVIGLDDGRYLASGRSPNLIGTDVREVKDAAGKPLFKEMIALARDKGTGRLDYMWRNPVTNAVEHKHTLVQRVGDVLLGVGYYSRP